MKSNKVSGFQHVTRTTVSRGDCLGRSQEAGTSDGLAVEGKGGGIRSGKTSHRKVNPSDPSRGSNRGALPAEPEKPAEAKQPDGGLSPDWTQWRPRRHPRLLIAWWLVFLAWVSLLVWLGWSS